MTFHKLYKLAEKLSVKTAEFSKYELSQQEKERLLDFKSQLNTQFGNILNELEGDLLTLRIKKFPKEDWRELVKLHRQLLDFKKSLLDDKPYAAAQKIIDVVNNRNIKAKLTTFNHIINHFLENNQVDLESGPNSGLKQVSVNSLTKLQEFAQKLRNYMIEHPLMEPNVDSGVRAVLPEVEDSTKKVAKK